MCVNTPNAKIAGWCNGSRTGTLTVLILVLAAFCGSSLAQVKEQVLYSFQGTPDGSIPVGGMVFDQRGNLYGATSSGGAISCAGTAQCGTIFELSPPAQEGQPWTESVIYVFKGRGYSDGAAPEGGLIIDPEGNLYGTTAYDGSGPCTLLGSIVGCGVVFKLSPPAQSGASWTETILYNFQGGADGYFPRGDLVLDKDGNLYGATQFGGGYGAGCNSLYPYCGTIFELSPVKGASKVSWTEKILYAFKGITPGTVAGDGGEPNGSLAIDDAGNLYGTTYYGGLATGYCRKQDAGSGCGIVFELKPPTASAPFWTEDVLRSFDVYDGANPASGLSRDPKGNLYGTTIGGGIEGWGTAFLLAVPRPGKKTWIESVLHRWDETDGYQPVGPLTLTADGLILATASGGGPYRGGTFSVIYPDSASEGGWRDTVLYSFYQSNTDAGYPDAKLILGESHSLFSSSQAGGTGQNCGYGGCGTVFRIQQ